MAIQSKKYAHLIDKIIIDPEDEWVLEKHNWSFSVGGKYLSGTINSKKVYLHRFLLGITDRKTEVDHKNQNTLDFRRCNLRACTHSQNNQNKGLQSNNTTGYKGVVFSKDKNRIKRYRAELKHLGKRYNLGRYLTAEEAALAYNIKAIELFGEHACLNVIPAEMPQNQAAMSAN